MRYGGRWLILVLVFTLGPPAAADNKTLLAEAQAALEKQDAATAEALFRQLLAEDSDLLPAYLGLAEAVARQERRPEAVTILVQLGEGLLRAGVYESAIDALQQAVEMAPDSGTAHALLGRAASQERRYVEAAARLERAVALGTSDLRTLLYLGAAHWENGDAGRAETAYRRAVVIGGSSFLPLHHLGRLLSWQGRSTEAIEVLERAARMASAADVELDLARALLAAGEIERAVAAFRRVVTLSPPRPHGRYGLAQALTRAGRSEDARAELEVYRELYAAEQQRVRAEELAKARLGHGWELLRSRRTAAALAHFESLPLSADALVGVAAVHRATGAGAAAITALKRAVELAPDRGDLRLRLAEARLEVAP